MLDIFARLLSSIATGAWLLAVPLISSVPGDQYNGCSGKAGSSSGGYTGVNAHATPSIA